MNNLEINFVPSDPYFGFIFVLNGRKYSKTGLIPELSPLHPIIAQIDYTELKNPPFLLFLNNNQWIIGESILLNEIEILQWSSPDALNERIIHFEYLNPANLPSDEFPLSTYFRSYNLRQIDPNQPTFEQLVNQRKSSADSEFEIILPLNCQIDPIYYESYETLLKEIYKFRQYPTGYLTINRKQVPLISYDRLRNMFNNSQIQKYEFNPILQPWAALANKIITVYDKNGNIYLTEVRYDLKTKTILGPI